MTTARNPNLLLNAEAIGPVKMDKYIIITNL